MATDAKHTVTIDTSKPQVLGEPNVGDSSIGDDDRDRSVTPSLKRGKPPPLDVTATKEVQEKPPASAALDPKTPTGAAPGVSFSMDKPKAKERKLGHRRVGDEGQVTFKKIETSQIMGSIQLGMAYAVGSLASVPQHDLLLQDFAIVETTSFPHEGSSITPAHRYSSFKFKTYAPVAFRRFRDLFGIKPDDFLLSLCHYPLRELTNPGASGSIFYLSDDDEFIIKTVQRKEAEFLQRLLPGYYMNLNQNPRTLLPKFFGLYCYQCGGKNVRLIIMNNLLPSSVKLHEKYDLKGSTFKRKANKLERSKSLPTFKDLDFMERHSEGILLEPETYGALMKTIQRDCRVLESFKIMDYSLLVGIHNLDLAMRESRREETVTKSMDSGNNGQPSGETTESVPPSQTQAGSSNISLVRSKSINRQRLAAFSTAMESIQVDVEADDRKMDFPPGGIPAKGVNGDRLLLFLGIIDILQSFHLKKKLEHTWKSMLHDGDTVSVHRPSFYAQRFQDFMGKTVFQKIPPPPLKRSPSKKKGHQRALSLAESEQFMRSRVPSDSARNESTVVGRSVSMRVPLPASPHHPDKACVDISSITLDFGDKSSSNADRPKPPKLREFGMTEKSETIESD